MSYILAAVLVVTIGLIIWLRWIVSKTVVQPVKKGELIGPFLSEKRRYKAIKEDHGWLIGFVIGLAIGIILCYG